jgi:hypothetical protein
MKRERSLAWIIEQRIELNARDVFHVVKSLVGELAGLDKSGRTCALNPRTVLVCGPGRIQFCEVRLAQSVSVQADLAMQSCNLRALAEIIYYLVEPDRSAIGPPDEGDWARVFGGESKSWQAFYEALARSGAEGEALDIERLQEQIGNLKPGWEFLKWSDHYRLEVSVAACLVLSMAGFGGYLWKRADENSGELIKKLARFLGNPNIPPDGWSIWTNQVTWFPQFLQDVVPGSPDWTNESYFNAPIFPILQVAATNGVLSILPQSNPPKPIWANTNKGLYRWLLQASTNGDAALRNWGTRFVTGAEAFEKLGWHKSAQQLWSTGSELQTNRQDFRTKMEVYVGSWAQFSSAHRAWTNVCQDAALLEVDGLAGWSNRFLAMVPGGAEDTLVGLQQKLDYLGQEQADQLQQFVSHHWKCLDNADKQRNPPPSSWEDWNAIKKWMGNEELTRVNCRITNLQAILSHKFSSNVIRKQWTERSKHLPEMKLVQLGNFFIEMEEPGFLPVLSDSLPEDDVGRELAAFARREREKALNDIITDLAQNWKEGVPQEGFAALTNTDRVIAQRVGFLVCHESLKQFNAEVRKITDWLDTADCESARASFLKWNQEGQCLHELVSTRFFQRSLANLVKLEAIYTDSITNRDRYLQELLGLLPTAPLGIAWAEWQQFGSVQAGRWPPDLIQITNAAQAQGAVLERVERMKNAERREGLLGELGTNAVRLLARSYQVLTNDAELLGAEGVLAQNRITNMTALPDWLKYDRKLLQLHRATAELPESETNQARDLRDTFVTDTTNLALAPPLRTKLGRLAGLDFFRTQPRVEPRVLANRQKWLELAPTNDGRVRYRWPTNDFGPANELEFVLVDLGDCDPFYLCTTEMPVGLVVDWNWSKENVRDWIPWLRAGNEDEPPGVRTWEANNARRPFKVATGWQRGETASNFFIGHPEYLTTNAPNRMHPINYLPPEAARRMAEAFGFRLPTRDEWRTAVESNVQDGKPNLRDETWHKWFQVVTGIRNKGGARSYETSLFPGTGAFNTKMILPEADSDYYGGGTNDFILWFSEVNCGPGRPFVHLIGNVAEYLFEEGAGDGGGRYFVAGGSALSSPQLGCTTIHMVKEKDLGLSYADVGFRLARETNLPPVKLFLRWVKRLNFVRDEFGTQP